MEQYDEEDRKQKNIDNRESMNADVDDVQDDSDGYAYDNELENRSGVGKCVKDVGVQCCIISSSVLKPPKPIRRRTVKTQVNLRKPATSIGTQMEEDTTQKETKSKIISSTPRKRKLEETLDFETDDDMPDPIDRSGSLYEPSYINESTDSEEISDTPIYDEEKYIVFRSKLWELFKTCSLCMGPCEVTDYVKGSMISVTKTCPKCNEKLTWYSQPMVKNIPAGNLLLSASILFAGASPIKVLRVLKNANITSISDRTYCNHARDFLYPTIWHVWQEEQAELFEQLREMEDGLVLGGDGRNDSPGHCAKYGSYSVLESRINKVIDVELVQSNEVGGSTHMEKEGLVRAMEKIINDHGLDVAILVTDRHPQIQKWVRETLKDVGVTHYYDPWHICKGLKAKLLKLAMQRDCEDLMSWIKSIINHIYWAASSTPDGNGDVIVAKVESIINHIQNKHEHDNPLYSSCSHPPLTDTESRKKWLKPSTKVSVKFEELISTKRFVKDIYKMSPLHHTSNVEAYHNVIIHFCPKMHVYSFIGMLCRLLLAAMHFNYNSDRPNLTDTDGNPIIRIKFPKFKKGEYSIQSRKAAALYDYVTRLMEKLFNEVVQDPKTFFDEMSTHITVPQPLSAEFHRPTVQEALSSFTSRFGKKV